MTHVKTNKNMMSFRWRNLKNLKLKNLKQLRILAHTVQLHVTP
jgi:hypothetical protein